MKFSPCSFQMWEITDQNNSEYGHFSPSVQKKKKKNSATNYKNDDRLFMKISGKTDSPSLSYWPLDMIFHFGYYENHHIQMQYDYKVKFQKVFIQFSIS